jgi:hypothetical protein
MAKNSEAERDPLKLLGVFILKLPSFTFRFGGEFIRFKSRANKAGRVFQKELVRQGLDKTTASQLTAFYLEGSNPFKLLQSLR